MKSPIVLTNAMKAALNNGMLPSEEGKFVEVGPETAKLMLADIERATQEDLSM